MAESLSDNTRPTESNLDARQDWQAKMAARQHISGLTLSNFQEALTFENLENNPQYWDDEFIVSNALDNLLTSSSQAEEVDSLLEYVDYVRSVARGQRERDPDSFYDMLLPKDFDASDLNSVLFKDPLVGWLLSRGDLIEESQLRFRETWPRFKQRYTEGIQVGIDSGYVPNDVADRLDDAFAKTSVKMIDGAILDAQDQVAYLGGTIGLANYSASDDEISLRHDLRIVDGAHAELAHEFTHKVSGGTFIKTMETDFEEQSRIRAGFANTSHRHTGVNKESLNEAITEHVALGIISGDFETIDPDERADQSEVYYDFRKLLAVFVERSHGIIKPKTITQAYFEDTGPNGSTQARRRLLREASRAYGPGALTKLERAMNLSQVSLEEKVDSIIPPTIDEQGAVVTRGSIDIETLQALREPRWRAGAEQLNNLLAEYFKSRGASFGDEPLS